MSNQSKLLPQMPAPADSPIVSRTSTSSRRGGRGCPQCGSHETKLLGKVEQLCRECGHAWQPCAPFCRGYRCDVRHEDGPTIIGCPDCGVPNRIARFWPEAWRALARELDKGKLEPVPDEL